MVHEPARLLIMTHLYLVESADFVYLVNQTGLTWGNLSVQISRLEQHGYVVVEKGYRGRKPRSTAALTPSGRSAFEQYRADMMRMLTGNSGTL